MQPDYVGFEPAAREELLSQIGSLSPLERSLFHKLCESWSPVIDRNRFIARAGSSEQDITALDRLMKQLRAAELGIVTSSVIDRKRVPTGIVLTSKGDLRFYMHLVEEETSRLNESGYRVLPSVARLVQRNVTIPDYHITDVGSATLVEAFTANEHEDAIFRVRLLGEFEIVATGRSVKQLIGAVVGWLRANLEERGLLEEIARVKTTTIMDIKQRIADSAPKTWLDITRTIVDNRSEIAYRKGLDESDEIFQAAFLIMNFTEARLGAARARKEDEEKVEQELSVLAATVSEVVIMDSDEFNRLAAEAEGRLENAAGLFRGRIASVLMTPRPRRKLPIVSNLANRYVHRNNLRTVFENARIRVSRQLRDEYGDLMEAFLRGRMPEVGEIFSSRADLDDDVRGRVERLDALLADLISRPQLLAEAVIRHAKQNKEGITTDELKIKLSPYFNVRDSELLPPSVLLDVDLLACYDQAFARLSVIRQLILRISGRHESLRKSYLRRFGAGSTRISYADDGDAGAPRGGRTRTERADAPGTRYRGTGNRDYSPDTTSPDQRRRRVPIPPQPRIKTPGEVERAWKDFGEALHAKGVSDEDLS